MYTQLYTTTIAKYKNLAPSYIRINLMFLSVASFQTKILKIS